MSSENIENQIIDHSYDKECVEEINKLHDDIRQQAEAMLPKIMRIGELLVAKKEKIPHGQFTKWITENLPFTPRTAQNYMLIFRNKEQLKNENISLLSNAYNILKLSNAPLKETGDEDDKKYFITFSLFIEQKEVLEEALQLAQEILNTRSNSESIYRIAYDWFQLNVK